MDMGPSLLECVASLTSIRWKFIYNKIIYIRICGFEFICNMHFPNLWKKCNLILPMTTPITQSSRAFDREKTERFG